MIYILVPTSVTFLSRKPWRSPPPSPPPPALSQLGRAASTILAASRSVLPAASSTTSAQVRPPLSGRERGRSPALPGLRLEGTFFISAPVSSRLADSGWCLSLLAMSLQDAAVPPAGRRCPSSSGRSGVCAGAVASNLQGFSVALNSHAPDSFRVF